MKFTKMHGNGNDFIVIEDLNNTIGDDGKVASTLCHRNFGIGGDGILIVRKSTIADIQMVIINSDGSYAAMCGNGIRCFAKYVWENKLVNKTNMKIETGDGIKIAHLTIKDNKVLEVTINMGLPSFVLNEIPAIWHKELVDEKVLINNKEYTISTLLMGVPHTVVFGPLSKVNVEEGKYIEKHSIFPKGTNVNFCEVLSVDEISVKTWERGAGPTLACGTGSCAAVVMANKLNLANKKVKVNIPGGSLIIELKEDGVYMTGPATTTFIGELIME